ncbi:hypothetical protein [Mycoplasmopsis felis]|uniref:hypothetical protein n=1 Tax=Mycoplasmopsis felis TaxID=33923 RepID=UPI002AFFCD44|nr:hypothetical protein [Mycoplasmopsis felis]WQQ04726.1 hypothetical protein RRG55_00045 [Mycoplasmopsis felis]
MKKDKGIEKFIYFLHDLINSDQNGNTGEEFEELIKRKLRNNDCISYSFNNKDEVSFIKNFLTIDNDTYTKKFTELRSQVLNKNNLEVILNPFKGYFKNDIYIYIYQPFGSQNFPDFLILTNNYVIPLEVKFSKRSKNSELPKWNSNIPKSNSIYLYANSKKQKPIVFLGDDFLGHETRILLNNYFDEFNQNEKTKNLLERIKKDENSYNPFGLFPKIRTDFLYKDDFIFHNQEKLNIFEFSQIMNWKENVFAFLEGLLEYEE